MRDLRRIRGILGRGVVAGAIVLGSIGLAAAPASADSASFTTAGGIVGVQQSVAYNIQLDQGTNIASVVVTATNSTGATPLNNVFTVPNPVYGANTGTFIWIPPAVGIWTFGVNVVGSPISTVTGTTMIQPVAVSTTLSAPNTAQIGVATTLTATIASQAGSIYAPIGYVQFAQTGVGNMGGPVWVGGSKNPGVATLQWTPQVLGSATFTATFIPNMRNGFADATCGSVCTSTPDVIQVTATGSAFFLANPPQMFAGTPATIKAVVGVVPPTGTVNFFANGGVIAANVAVNANGIAQTTWTPPAAGNVTISATWTGVGGVTGSAQEVIPVAAGAPAVDVIVVAPAGQNPWSPAVPQTMANGTSIGFTANASSGAAVTLTDSGPCTMSGNTLNATQGVGQCRLIASSPGGNGYAANQVTFTVNLIPGTQTARLAAPRTGSTFQRGRTVRLENPAQGQTNAGATIHWRVLNNSRNNCRLRFPANGAVNLQLQRAGQCNVRATAPGVANQWNAFRLDLRYRVR